MRSRGGRGVRGVKRSMVEDAKRIARIDNNVSGMKMKIPPFQGKVD